MDEEHNVGGFRPDEVYNVGENDETKDIVILCSSEYKEYTFNEKQDIWSLVTLNAPCQVDDDSEEQRAPIDIVAVIDKSGSMSGTKINLVKKTLEFVLTQLTDRDRLSIVTYDASVYLDFSLMNMSKENKEFASDKINAISEGSTTNLCGGLLKGICQMLDRQEKNEVASVLLFTDGLANNGITNITGIVKAMGDPKRFDGPSKTQVKKQPHKNFLQKALGSKTKTQKNNVTGSDTTVSTSASSKTPSSDYTVYTFGFGEDHNPDMLKKISDAGNGMYYYIENEDKIAESFGHCLGGLMSTVAQGIQLEITTEEGVTIKGIHTAKPSEKVNDRCVKIDMGDLQSEEKRDVLLELTINSLNMPGNDIKQKLLSARIDYFNVVTSELSANNGDLDVLRLENDAVRHDQETLNRDVAQQRTRVRMTSVMKKATEQAESGELEVARQGLLSEIESANAAMEISANDEEKQAYVGMSRDLQQCVDSMQNVTQFQNKGKKLQMNIQQQYCAQRSSNIDSLAFVTKTKMKKQSMAKRFVLE